MKIQCDQSRHDVKATGNIVKGRFVGTILERPTALVKGQVVSLGEYSRKVNVAVKQLPDGRKRFAVSQPSDSKLTFTFK